VSLELVVSYVWWYETRWLSYTRNLIKWCLHRDFATAHIRNRNIECNLSFLAESSSSLLENSWALLEEYCFDFDQSCLSDGAKYCRIVSRFCQIWQRFATFSESGIFRTFWQISPISSKSNRLTKRGKIRSRFAKVQRDSFEARFRSDNINLNI